MTEFTADQLEFLRRYGFDEELFRSWQEGVRSGRLSLDNNVLRGEILAPEPGSIHELPKRGSEAWNELEAIGAAAIARGEFGVVVLNGGMATRFGGVVKGVVEVLGGRSFLALKAEDIRRAEERYGGRIPLFLMNSFATEAATKEHFTAHGDFGLAPGQVTHFAQFVSVRMERDGAVFRTESGDISPYGPGHGDFPAAFRASGCLDAFRRGGGKYLFLCNVDNLGARVDAVILGQHVRSAVEMTVEVAPKWPGDVGGSPFVVDGKLQLVEQIRYPPGFDPDIVDVFNTNTFHFTAAALDREFDLGRYYVQKKVEARPAVQIEHLVGETSRFLAADYLRVKRTGASNRFFPIKTPEDLEGGREEIAELYPR